MVALELGIHNNKFDWIRGVYVGVIKIVTNPSLMGQFDPHRNEREMGENGISFHLPKKYKKSGTIHNKHTHKSRHETIERPQCRTHTHTHTYLGCFIKDFYDS